MTEENQKLYDKLKKQKSRLVLKLKYVNQELTRLEMTCEKCGEDISDAEMDWDYDDVGEKYEFSVCNGCGNREEYYQ